MKKLLLLLCLPMIGFGQTWKSNSGENDIDGKYRISYVTGTSNSFSNDSSQLVIKYFERSNDYVLYVNLPFRYTSGTLTNGALHFEQNCGFYHSNMNLPNFYIFNSKLDSSDYNNIFMSDFHLGNWHLRERSAHPYQTDKFDIINKLMNSSYVCIRWTNTNSDTSRWDFVTDVISPGLGNEYMTFSLKGSSKAIKFTIPDIDNRINELSKKREKAHSVPESIRRMLRESESGEE